jgi:hypothetical protein
MPSGFYLQWKYPNTARKLTTSFFLCLIAYLAVYFLFIAPPKKIIEANSLQRITGKINQIDSSQVSAVKLIKLTLAEFPQKQFSFDTMSKTSADLGGLREGDCVKLLVLKSAISNNLNLIPSYELENNGTLFFSLHKYNSSISGDIKLFIIFLVMAFIILATYFIIEETGFSKWLNNKLSSEDKNFQANKPNFNEFLDR